MTLMKADGSLLRKKSYRNCLDVIEEYLSTLRYCPGLLRYT